MYELDKERFGGFVAGLRKEKGLTQKELAQRLCLSDKAVSKWERGLSMPDISMLIPLAEALDVTVTELLTQRRVSVSETMDTSQVEELVKRAIRIKEYDHQTDKAVLKKRGLAYALCVLLAVLEMAALFLLDFEPGSLFTTVLTFELLCAVFGAYLCFFAKARLPAYYDGNKISSYSDGVFRMNVPGVHFTNRNWPHILRLSRRFMLVSMPVYPLVYFVLAAALPTEWEHTASVVLLILFLLCFFVPFYYAARRYE